MLVDFMLPRTSCWALPPKLGTLSNRDSEYQAQSILVKDANGRLRFTRFTRRDSTLPTEILTLIFVQCLPDDEFVIPSPTAAPLLLGAVCSRWRDIVLSTPRLWASLALEFDPMWDREAAKTVDFYQMWLSRARAAPLSLLVEDMEVPAPVPGTKAFLLQMVVGLSQQWQNVELSLPEDDLSSSFPVDGKYPLLENLSLTFSGDSLHHSTPISFCDAPKLRAVFLCPYDRHIQLPWHQLTLFRTENIILRGRSAHSFLENLGRASNLVDASLDIITFESEPSALPEAVPLLRLQSLHVTEDDPDSLMTLLSCLKAPSLKILSLDGSPHSSTGILPFLSFVSRSSFHLHTLQISRMPATTDLLIQCLKATPSVVHLKIKPRQLDTILAQFTGHADFLPKLESFHLVVVYSRISGVTPTIATDVLNMLCWRWAAVGVSRLQSFRLAYNAKEPRFNCNGKIPGLDGALSSHSKFRQLQEEGMVLYVGHAESIDYSL